VKPKTVTRTQRTQRVTARPVKGGAVVSKKVGMKTKPVRPTY
jgi:hypothetical protein